MPVTAPEHADRMRRALAVAARSGPDVPIGAVVYASDGTELAAAHNRREATGDPTAHAELLALREAARVHGDGWRLSDCVLVVTVEPCTMCAGAITLARVGTVVFGAWEPKTGAVGSLWDVLRDRRLSHRPQVYAGVLADECAALLRDFFAPGPPTNEPSPSSRSPKFDALGQAGCRRFTSPLPTVDGNR